jgi:hypothetical protein
MQQAVVGQIILTPAEALRADIYPAEGDGVLDSSDLLVLEVLLTVL